ncbi:hypothetical protein Celaphus_00004161 [Cervus elaphus hippelaphus]|uniref:Chemokine interleukin-8-like domain-containing protein n=1 Tax=Cervus elaphus hippelaphus TaxID=46360 RepID=A0A212DCG5_CEREH|nr:hypothetical protein Celaphus_00004161 [Cervus elaphus hippelaphus]
MAPLKALLLAALLLGALLQDTHAGPIPGKLLVDWYQTPGDCPNNAIVLVTRHGKNICANPKDKNVKRAMRYLQKHRKSPDLAA